MSEHEREFIAEFKKQIIIFIVIGVVTVVGTSVGFYFNTNSAIDSLHSGQRALEKKQTKSESMYQELKDSKIDKADYIREVDEMKVMLRELNNKLDRINRQ